MCMYFIAASVHLLETIYISVSVQVIILSLCATVLTGYFNFYRNGNYNTLPREILPKNWTIS